MKIIRRLRTGEGALYRSVRLESLRNSPEAFSSKYEDAVARSEDSWNAQADSTASGSDRATFVFIDEEPCGLGAVYRDNDEVEVGELIQMWISPKYRGSSAAEDLLNKIFQWAALNRISRIKAEVQKDNKRAMKFYQNYGFVPSEDVNLHSDSSVMLTKPVEQGSGGNSYRRATL